jgi:hypothetical protein
MQLPLPIVNVRVPTDREILEAIYCHYYLTFCNFQRDDAGRRAKIYVPIDIKAVAQKLNVDQDIVFGRLYYYLDRKFGYRPKGETQQPFFSLKIGEDVHCVNFPLLVSVLAEFQEQHRRVSKTFWVSIGSLAVAFLSLVISLATLASRFGR